MAVYSITTQKLLFTTFLEQDTLETSEGVFSENGEYVFFRTTDPNWCSGLTLDQCRATSTQQTTIVIANIVELEKLPEESVINEILSVEEGAPGEEIDIVFEDIPVIELILPEETSSLTEVSDTIPIDTNTYVPAATEILDMVLPLSPESAETLLVTEQIVPLDIEPVLTGPVK